MSDGEYAGWVGRHVEATAAPPEAAAALLSQFTREAFAEWGATPGELDDCTRRLIRGRRVPKFANEHADAVALELHHQRDEAARAERPDPAEWYAAPRAVGCRLCGDTGLVTVPLFLCVEAPRYGPPRLVPLPGYRSPLVGAVLCSEPGCEPGRVARDREGRRQLPEGKRPRPTLAKYLERFRGVDVVALLARYEREAVAAARRRPGADAPGWAELVERLKARATELAQEGTS